MNQTNWEQKSNEKKYGTHVFSNWNEILVYVRMFVIKIPDFFFSDFVFVKLREISRAQITNDNDYDSSMLQIGQRMWL